MLPENPLLDLLKQHFPECFDKDGVFFDSALPVAGGGAYSPDFAYIVKTGSGQTLNLMVESKDVEDSAQLRQDEAQKIKHTEELFKGICATEQVQRFTTQFHGEKIADWLREVSANANAAET